MKLAELVDAIGGNLDGDGELEITGIAALADAGPGELGFLANPKYAAMVAATGASAVLVADGWEGSAPCALIRVTNPDKGMALAAGLLAPSTDAAPVPGIHATAVVADDSVVDPAASIGPLCVIEPGVVIGAGTVLEAGCYVGRESVIGTDCLLRVHAIVRERVKIGDRVILNEAAVIGGDGFGNYRDGGEWKKIPHIGTVELGDDVEVGANTAVDRARFGKTVIGRGAKIDNLVQVAHNVEVGEDVAMAAQVGVSGSTKIGANAILGGQVGLAGHLKVGEGAVVGAQAGVTKNVPPETYVTGYPAMPHRKAAESHAHLMRMPALKERVKTLEERLAALEKEITTAPSNRR